jgi:hypothetical protein
MLLRRYLSESHRLKPLPKPDLWTSLRHAYTGPNFFISLLFLVAFATPYIAQAMLLSQIGRAESSLIAAVGVIAGKDVDAPAVSPDERAAIRTRVRTDLIALQQSFLETANTLREAARLTSGITGPEPVVVTDRARTSLIRAADSMTELGDRMKGFRADVGTLAAGAMEERRYPIWKILLGIDTGQLGWALLLSLLLVYNGLRWFLTTNVAALRDAEERSHVTPAKVDYFAFGPLHRVVEWLFWLSLASGTYTFFQWMTTPVYKFW